MKRSIKLILTVVLALITVIGLSACDKLNIRFPSGCKSEQPSQGQEVTPIIVLDNTETELKMTMVKDRSFYYPTIEGKVKLSFMPTKFEVFVDGKESFDITDADFTNLSYSSENYIVSFKKVHIFGSLETGDYKVTVKAYNGDKASLIDKYTTFKVDDWYTACFGVDFETGEQIEAMDKESNWIGPYNENELPVMPITDGGNFVASGFDFEFWS